MNYVGIDIHKRYSVLVAIGERGQGLRRGRINGNSAFGFAQFFAALAGPSKVVLEACWNWGRIHDLLKEIDSIEEVVLAHPLKTRLIADAQIKTDALDAKALATLLRGDLIARGHVPGKATRQRKEVLRQRLYWARLRTRIRNRIHSLIDRQRELAMPQCSDLFGRKGLVALKKLSLAEPNATPFAELMDAESLRGPHWLISYELAVRDWVKPHSGADHISSDSFFAFLRENSVRFYDSTAVEALTGRPDEEEEIPY